MTSLSLYPRKCLNEIFYHTGIKITDFQIPDKMSDTIKYLPVILKIATKGK